MPQIWPKSGGGTLVEQLARLQRRVHREHAARHEAERLLESKSLELFALNQQLTSLNAELESRVAIRTRELEATRASAAAILERDYLTGTSSRARYRQELDRAVAAAAAGSGCVGLLLIDLDDFKRVNDTYGHSLGDDLLCGVALRLAEGARAEDMIARIGGDEFAVIMPGHHPRTLIGTAQHYRQTLDQPFTLDGLTFQCRASLGLAIAPQDAASSSDLQRFADLALFNAKNRGGGDLTVFQEDLRAAYDDRQLLESEFMLAIERDEVEVCFQPIVNLATGRIGAVETLARWRDSKGRAVAPDVFIDMAEKKGQITRLSQQLLRKALTAARPWAEQGLIERLTFNISPLDLLHPGFVDRISRILAGCGYPGERLVLEITEGVLLDDLQAATEVIATLASKKVMFALDDFGSGYSNLLYLRHLPLAALKLDRSLVQGIGSDGGAMAIVRNLIALCNDLDIRAICEGVETEEQARILTFMSCEYAQGYLFSKPLWAAEADLVLRQGLPLVA
jgi:diguanylate cyclase (GGDEF)-like protein